MKIYESAFTYFPFLYMFSMSSIFGGLYHNVHLRLYQPYMVMIFLFINTIVYYLYDTKKLIKTVVHRHVWRTVTLSIYGILINNIHTEMFRDFHFSSWWVNVIISFLYMVGVSLCRYYFDRDSYVVYCHILFSFFPLQRVWQVNLYMYVIFTTMSVILMFRRIMVSDLKSNSIHVRPVINYFMYLRVYDMFVMFGFIQLYLDLYMSHLPEMKAVEEIQTILKSERERIGKFEEE